MCFCSIGLILVNWYLCQLDKELAAKAAKVHTPNSRKTHMSHISHMTFVVDLDVWVQEAQTILSVQEALKNPPPPVTPKGKRGKSEPAASSEPPVVPLWPY